MASCFNVPDFITSRKRDLSITPPSGSIIIQSSERIRPIASASFWIMASPNFLSTSRISFSESRSFSERMVDAVDLNIQLTYLSLRTPHGRFSPVKLVFQGELPKDRVRCCEALRCASKGLQRVSFAAPPH